jgi:hypothetical protein
MVEVVPVIPCRHSLLAGCNVTGRATRAPSVVKQQHIADDCRSGGVAKKVLCFTWFLGSIADTYIRYVVSLVTNVVCRLRILNNSWWL